MYNGPCIEIDGQSGWFYRGRALLLLLLLLLEHLLLRLAAAGTLVAVGTCVAVGVAVCSCLVVIEKVYLTLAPHPVP